MRLLLLAGPAAAARILPFCPDDAEILVRRELAAGAAAGGADPTADVAIACDAEGRLLLAGLPEQTARVAFVGCYGLDPAAEDLGDPASVDRWAVGHAAVATTLRAQGVPADAIEVTGIPVPEGFAAPADRAAARASAGLPADGHVLVVRTDAAPDEIGALLVQLALLAERPWILFDVGEDVAAATRLRAEVPHHALHAKMFAAGHDEGAHAALGDLLVVPPDPDAVARGASCGVPMVALGRPARGALDAALEGGAVRLCSSLGRLAADVDLLRAPERLASARAAAVALAVPDATDRFRALVTRAATDKSTWAAQRRRRGLPVGLEDLSGPSPAPEAAPRPPRRPVPDIDAELEALRRKIGKP